MDQELLILLPDQSLTFSSADHIKHKMLKYAIQNASTFVIVDGRYVRHIDATVAKVCIPFVIEHFRNFWKTKLIFATNRISIFISISIHSRYVQLWKIYICSSERCIFGIGTRNRWVFCADWIPKCLHYSVMLNRKMSYWNPWALRMVSMEIIYEYRSMHPDNIDGQMSLLAMTVMMVIIHIQWNANQC